MRKLWLYYQWIGMYKLILRTFQKKTQLIAFSCVLLFPLQTQAFEILTNGFGTVCASKSDVSKSASVNVPAYPFLTQLGTVAPFVAPSFYRPQYIGAERRWNFLPNSKFALQFTSIFDDKFKAVVQVIGRWENMTEDHYAANMDWAYLQYNRNNQFDTQFGRFRVPAFYYSDFLDVNNAQPWVMPPDEVYFIVGGAFRNMDGIKARYSYYYNNWTLNSQLYYGSMEEKLFILFSNVNIKVRDVTGFAAQLDNDIITLRGSVMRSVYDTNLYGPLIGLTQATNTIAGATKASQNLLTVTQDKDKSIVYVGLAAAANVTDNLTLLFERASILSPGIISTSRVGWYGAISYSMEKFAYTFTYGFSRALETDIRKWEAVNNFVNTPQYKLIDKGSGAGAAVAEAFKSYLGKQRSYAIDVRYDLIPSVALKGSVKYVTPAGGDSSRVRYILNRLPVFKNIWVYRLSLDFVF
jgi:hypothetical protein